ncbi:MAG: MotA/TolQ/ExbB proton channel family protein [Kiritimatiellaeota bacterium]|nr:MotA/TolQ/ExbB proton channel family protein [Kiritimatiellota bacterium]
MFDFTVSLPVASLVEAFHNADMMGKSIVVIQLFLSVFVWTLMIGKGRELKAMHRGCGEFGRLFARAADVLELYLGRTRQLHDTPLDTIYLKTCDRLVRFFDRENRAAMIAAKSAGGLGDPVSGKEIELVCGTAEHLLAEQTLRAEKGMNTLATMSTVAPLLGLLGTVWGVLDAFQIFGASGAGQLTEMAPAISSALLTTVVGLLVAIPSSIGYNILHGGVRKINIELEGFVDELTGRMAYEFQGRGD